MVDLEDNPDQIYDHSAQVVNAAQNSVNLNHFSFRGRDANQCLSLGHPIQDLVK